MTKAVKVYRGSVAADAATTVYTVPAGRVAKVTFAYLRNYSTTPVELHAGGVKLADESTPSQGAGFPAVYAQTTTNLATLMSGDAHLFGKFASGGKVVIASGDMQAVPKDVYLTAGDTVQVRGGHYSFLVVEEY